MSYDDNISPELVNELIQTLNFGPGMDAYSTQLPIRKTTKRGANRKPYSKKVTEVGQTPKIKRERKPRSPKTAGKKQTAPGSLWWFVQHGAIKPAPKCEPSPSDPSGYHYLKQLDLQNSPYTVLVGCYKRDQRFFVVGKVSSDRFELVYLPDIEIFPSPTSAPSYFIRNYQENDPEGVKNDARMSGFEYLRFVSFKMTWMHEPEEYITLNAAKKRIEAEMQPIQVVVRDPDSLYQAQYPPELLEPTESLLDPNQWIIKQEPETTKQEYPYESYPSVEIASQCTAYLQFPDSFKQHLNYQEYVRTDQIKEEAINGGMIQMPEREEFEITDEQIEILFKATRWEE